ncbi:transposase zinc-binding domain-containing protein [Serratia marcescens]|nr:transposase zinc-binding domain-containing protein [Serratia marcescens]
MHWTSFLNAGGRRDIEVEAFTKMLACGTRIAGMKEYGCESTGCTHEICITKACHSRASLSCGKKATDLWTQPSLAAWRLITAVHRRQARPGHWHFLRHPYVRPSSQLASPRSCLPHLLQHR